MESYEKLMDLESQGLRWGTILMCSRCQKNFDFFEKYMYIL